MGSARQTAAPRWQRLRGHPAHCSGLPSDQSEAFRCIHRARGFVRSARCGAMLTKPPVGALLLLSIALNAIAFAYIWKAGPTVDGANSSQGDTAVLMTQHSELQDRMAQLQET